MTFCKTGGGTHIVDTGGKFPRIATGHSNFIQKTILAWAAICWNISPFQRHNFIISPNRECMAFFFLRFFLFSFALSAWNLPCHCHLCLEFFYDSSLFKELRHEIEFKYFDKMDTSMP